MTYRADFDLDGGPVWLNSSHQSALPRVAVAAAAEAAAWKAHPWELTTARFTDLPRQLREVIGRLTGVPADQVVLANGASYGLHLLANGLPLEPGDEVVVMKDDFPSNVLPWLMLARRGVVVRVVAPRGTVLEADEIEAAMTARTRVVCLSWVHSFSGHGLDVESIGACCRRRGAWFVVNTTQALGARPIDFSRAPIDAAVNSGWKWLCGPYATGFAWLRPELVGRLRRTQAYWLSMQTADDLSRAGEPVVPDRLDPRHLDVFGTANFLNVHPFVAALTYLEAQGLPAIESYVQGLVSRLVEGLDDATYRLVSRPDGPRRSSLVVFAHRDAARTAAVHARLLDAGLVTALRRGNIRVSPHLYNLDSEVDRLLEALRGAAKTV